MYGVVNYDLKLDTFSKIFTPSVIPTGLARCTHCLNNSFASKVVLGTGESVKQGLAIWSQRHLTFNVDDH